MPVRAAAMVRASIAPGQEPGLPRRAQPAYPWGATAPLSFIPSAKIWRIALHSLWRGRARRFLHCFSSSEM